MAGIILAIIAIVVAVLFGLIAWRQSIKRRPDIVLVSQAERLIPQIPDPDIEITWKDIPVKNPYLLRLGIRNAGSADLTSLMFDGQRPISAEIDGPVVTVVQNEQNLGWIHKSGEGVQSTAAFGPDLLKANDSTVLALIVSGRPTITWKTYLTDIAVREQVTGVGRFAGRRLFTQRTLLWIAGYVALAAALITYLLTRLASLG